MGFKQSLGPRQFRKGFRRAYKRKGSEEGLITGLKTRVSKQPTLLRGCAVQNKYFVHLIAFKPSSC